MVYFAYYRGKLFPKQETVKYNTVRSKFNYDEKEEDIMSDKNERIVKVVVPIIIAIISVFVLARFAASPEFHAKTIGALEDKKTTVMELTAASTAASTAITLLPGDAATPIADKLADLSTYFLVVLCAIYLEKYLVTITGYVTFVILIPVACAMLSASVLWKKEIWKAIAAKLIIFGITIFLVVPASVKVSNMIEKTYNSSIEKTLESAKQTTEEIEKDAEEEKSGISGIISSVKDGVAGAVEKVEHVLNNFIEALAVMLVTSCVIPIVVLLFFVWLIKMTVGANLSIPKKPELPGMN